MISVIAFVIAVWRALLYDSVNSSNIFSALSDALFIATILAECSDAFDSRII